MKASVSLLMAAVLAASGAFVPSSSPSGPSFASSPSFTIRKRVEEAHLSFSVKDRHGNAVNGLTPANLLVVQDGEPVTEITSFYRYDDLPLRLVIMIDTSDSMREAFSHERRMAESMLYRMQRSTADEVSIVSFSATSQITNTGEQENTLAAMQGLRAAGQTALYDTLYESIRGLMDRAEVTPVRRAIVVFSDGEDNWSRHNLLDVIAVAQQADLPIYAISVHSRRVEFQGDAILRQLADATGGRAFFPGNYGGFEKIYAAIGTDLQAHYVIGFRPAERSKQPGYHTTNVRIRDRKLDVRSRTGYYVP